MTNTPQTETPHTPGPWEVSPTDDWFIWAHSGVAIAKMFSDAGAAYRANARLIAAAPTYAQAWDAVVNTFNMLLAAKQSDSDIVAALDRLLDIHGAAIEKARGS